MTSKSNLPTYKGRRLGIVVLTSAQLYWSHSCFLRCSTSCLWGINFAGTEAYDVYTLVFGLLVLVFAVFIWQGKKAGWIGTVAVSLFVIVADALTVLNLPSIPGIPKFAALTEIAYSLLVVLYLLQTNIRKKYLS
jgi:hypothetical protein